MLLKPKKNDTSFYLQLQNVANEGKRLEKIETEFKLKMDKMLNRITNERNGYETEMKKIQNEWTTINVNEKNLSHLMLGLKEIKNVWSLQLIINQQLRKLEVNESEKKPKKETLILAYIDILQNIHEMSKIFNTLYLEMQSKSNAINSASFHSIVEQMKNEMKIYFIQFRNIVKYAFANIVQFQNNSISIAQSNSSLPYLCQLYDCLLENEEQLQNEFIQYVHQLLLKHIFNIMFDDKNSTQIFYEIEEANNISMKITANVISDDSLLLANVKTLFSLISWIEKNVFLNHSSLINYWKNEYLYKCLDEWMVIWIHSHSPFSYTFTFIPALEMENNENKDDGNETFFKCQEFEHQSFSAKVLLYEQEILQSISIINNEEYFIETLKLCSNVSSELIPNEIKQRIFTLVRRMISDQDFSVWNPSNLGIFANRSQWYSKLVENTEHFFLSHPCKIGKTTFEIIVILYNIIVFVDNQQKASNTLLVDIFMNICRSMIELWMSLSISYHRKYLFDIPSIGFQFHNECLFIAHHLQSISIQTNHGKIFVDHKNIWFADLIHPLKSLGKKYFLHHLHAQRNTISIALSSINREFRNIDIMKTYEEVHQNLSECLFSIAQFLNGCRSIIPDSLLYQIAAKLFSCVCSSVVQNIFHRIACESPRNDISVPSANHMCSLILHIQKFEVLSNDLEYVTRQMDDQQLWMKFKKLGDILHEKQTLKSLTIELENGLFNCFDQQTVILLIQALFQESPKRTDFIQKVQQSNLRV